MRTVSKPSSSRMATTSSTGTTAAPVTPRRKRGQVVSRPAGVAEQRLVEGGRTGQHRDPLVCDAGQHPVHVEHRLEHRGGPRHETGEQSRLVAEGVEQRVHHQVPVALAQPHDRRPRAEGPQRLAVGGHHPLGPAGGPRGEDEVRKVLGGHRGRPPSHLGFVCGRPAARRSARSVTGTASRGTDRFPPPSLRRTTTSASSPRSSPASRPG